MDSPKSYLLYTQKFPVPLDKCIGGTDTSTLDLAG